MMSPGRFLTLAGYAALGPITGPCAAGFVRNVRRGNLVLAGLWVVAWGLLWMDLGLLAKWSAGVLVG